MAKHEKTYSLLGICPLFEMLPDKDKRDLAKVCVHREISAGQFLFHQNQKADGFYIIVKGKVKIFRLSSDGKEQLLHLFGKGDVCGEVPVFQGGNYPASAKTQSKTEVLCISGNDFLDLGEKHPSILLDMLAVLSMRLRKFVDLIDDLSLKEVSARLAKYLLDKSLLDGDNCIELEYSKAMLAAKLGTIAETLSRTLAKMAKKGLIKVDGKTIKLLDKDKLQLICAGEKI